MPRTISEKEKILLEKVRPFFVYQEGKAQLVDAPDDVVSAYNELLRISEENTKNAVNIL